MRKLVWPVVVLLLTSACASVGVGDKGKVKLTRKLDALEDKLEAANVEVVGQEQKVEEARQKLEKAKAEKRKLEEERDKAYVALKKAEQLGENLLRRIGGPSPQDELAARKLLLVAKHFRQQNPTEARSIVAGKYREVFEKYPGAKAAKEAKKIYEKIMK